MLLLSKEGERKNKDKQKSPPSLFLLPDFRRRLGLDFALDELAALGLGAELERAGEAAELLGAEGPGEKREMRLRSRLVRE